MNPPRIDKNVPLPQKWPFSDMKVGDSFLVPDDIHRSTVTVAASRYGAKHKMRFTVRLTEDRKLRCWRTK